MAKRKDYPNEEEETMTHTFAQDIEAEAARHNEPILSVVIGEMGGWEHEDEIAIPNEVKGAVLDWETARPYLDYEYDTGDVDYDYDTGDGEPGCHAITAWTENRVIFVSQYDGATNVCSLPRHPVRMQPYMPGG